METSVLAALPIAIVVVDDAGLVTIWNEAAEVLYGHAASDAVGAPASSLLFEDEDRAGGDALLRSRSRWEGDFRVRRRDGNLLVSSFRLEPLDGGSCAWIATDPIDQGHAEQERAILLSAEHAARRAAEDAGALVEAIVSAAPVGIAVFDVDLNYVRANDAYAALKGLAPERLLGIRLGDILPVPPEVIADLRRVLTTGRSVTGRETDLGVPGQRHFQVSYFPVRAGDHLAGVGMTTIEVTEVRRAEAARAASLARAEAAQQRLAVLASASSVLTTTMDLDQMLGRLARVLAPSAADWCIIQLIGDDGSVEHVAVSHRDAEAGERLASSLRDHPVDRSGKGPVAEVLRDGQARLLAPHGAAAGLDQSAVDLGMSPFTEDFDIESGAIVPIAARGETFGVLIMSSDRGHTLDMDDLDLAVEVAHRAALAVANARLFHQEHQIAEGLQRAMLPATLPAIEDLDLAVRYVAATAGAEVGGDWYDVLSFDDGRHVALAIGDVVGHDIAASTSMGQLRHALRAYVCEVPNRPAEALARVDRLYDDLTIAHATCVLAVLEREPRRLTWSNAGHPPPLLLRGGRARYLEGGAGTILGVASGELVAEDSELLEDGDVLVLYTDGLVERRGESLDAGLDRLLRLASGLAGERADMIADALVAEMVPAGHRDDDVALLVARVGVPVRTSAVHRIPFDADMTSPAVARAFLAGVLTGAGRAGLVDTATLLASELVTNAIRHGSPPYALVVRMHEDAVEVAVEDGEASSPVAGNPEPLSESGRGLLLVDALAIEWGVNRRPDGKDTWFVLAAG